MSQVYLSIQEHHGRSVTVEIFVGGNNFTWSFAIGAGRELQETFAGRLGIHVGSVKNPRVTLETDIDAPIPIGAHWHLDKVIADELNAASVELDVCRRRIEVLGVRVSKDFELLSQIDVWQDLLLKELAEDKRILDALSSEAQHQDNSKCQKLNGLVGFAISDQLEQEVSGLVERGVTLERVFGVRVEGPWFDLV